jgi:hypothetical protein
MRRTDTTGVVTLGTLLLVTDLIATTCSVRPTDDYDNGPTGGPRAYGDFDTRYLGADQHLDFWAIDEGPSESDRGVAAYTNRSLAFAYTAELVCVSIVGNTARFGYVIPANSSIPGFLAGTNVVWQVIDNGGADPDTAGFTVAPALECERTDVPQQAIERGDIVVTAAAREGDERDV